MKIAVVGSGISGLSSAWALSEYSDHDVTLLEKDEYFGGHGHTVPYARPGIKEKRSVLVDTGFMVFNDLNYPNLIQLFKHLKVEYINSKMTFSVSKDFGKLEWAGTNLFTFFCQPKNLGSLRFWRMLYDIFRFHHLAPSFLKDSENKDWTIGQYLTQNHYGPGFIEDYLTPMAGAIWSTPPEKCFLTFPAKIMIRFMVNHCLLQVEGRPVWKTVAGGSYKYIQKMIEKIKDKRLQAGVTEVRPFEDNNQVTKVEITFNDGNKEIYDHVILATHGDTSLELLGENASVNEKLILGRVKYSENKVYLHNDETLMPINKLAWSSWNYIGVPKGHVKEEHICVTYHMNQLQSIDPSIYGDILITLNPYIAPRQDAIVQEFTYHHPIYSNELIQTQEQLGSIQSLPHRNLSFIGAWTCYGFHEDGLISGLKIAKSLGAKLPFPIKEPPQRSINLGILGYIIAFFFKLFDLFLLMFLLPILGKLNIKEQKPHYS